MRKLNLAAISYERDGILNVLQRTNAVEIKEHAEIAGTDVLPPCGEELRTYLSALESALATLETAADSAEKGKGKVQDGFSVTYAEFSQAAEKREWADSLVRKIGALTEEKAASLTEQAGITRALAAAKPYSNLQRPFEAYSDTHHAKVRLGVLPIVAWEGVKNKLSALPLVAFEEEKAGEYVLLTLVAHKSAFSEAEEILLGAGFSVCPYVGNVTGAQQYAQLENRLAEAVQRQKAAEEELLALTAEIRNFKIYCDYVGFELEKAEAASMMRATEHTFFLEAYVPAQGEEQVKAALEDISAIWYEFSDPAEDEPVPTLLKNNPVVANFETITNMYSPPNAREIDPNTVMSFFYSLFLGFIMADIGYGLLMLLGGGFLYFKSKKGGMKSLAGVFAVCGIFTIFWGAMFNSLFGIALPFYTSPMPVSYDLMTGQAPTMYTFVGIVLPGVLVISLLLGIVQLMAGYLCRMALCFHRGQILDGILDGGVWALFSVGMELSLIGLVEEFHLSILTTIGGIILAVTLVIAVFTAGRKEKFLGKITKGFGSLYGLINYLTDVLSYIRLYGLMLTGAVIAQVVSQYSLQFLTSGTVLAVLGAILMVIGHVFNIAIGLLGAYIHTARLQYVEFFGRFYEGEGRLFTPLGSNKKYINLENAA